MRREYFLVWICSELRNSLGAGKKNRELVVVMTHIPPPAPSHILVVIKTHSRRHDPRLCDPGGAPSHLQCGNMHTDFWSGCSEDLIKSYIKLHLILVGNTPLSTFKNAELSFGKLVSRNWRQTCQLCFTSIYTPLIKAV